MTDRWTVVLSDLERRICAMVGEAYWQNAQANHRDPGLGSSATATTAAGHIAGAECELGAAIMFNLSWRCRVMTITETRREPDVGGLLEVRSTDLEGGRLIVKPTDKSRPFVLIKRINGSLTCPGWAHADEAKTFRLETRFGDPSHWLDQDVLRKPETLLEWIKQQRT